MPLPASLIASVVSAVIEAAVQSSGATTGVQQYEYYTATRTLPPEAKQGVMFPPLGDGVVVIDGKSYRLAATAQVRSPQNLIVMPMTISPARVPNRKMMLVRRIRKSPSCRGLMSYRPTRGKHIARKGDFAKIRLSAPPRKSSKQR